MEEIFKQLVVGNEYSREELNTILVNNGYNGRNITAITYNRWNSGMTIGDFKNLMFEWIGRGQYKFLGLNSSYTGDCYWYPRRLPRILVGTWTEGKFIFADNNINSYGEWLESVSE